MATNLRKKRFSLFTSLIESIPGSLKILDVGGKQMFWDNLGFFEQETGDVEIPVMNVTKEPGSHPNFNSIIGDARDMKKFKDNQFDVVFSNSVIEHVGDYNDQQRMANEIRRVGKRYFVQTPNLYFPIEPHFVFPLFQFFPVGVKVWLISHFALGWHKKITDKQKARKEVTSIRLINKKDFLNLFANSKVVEENFLCLTKSFIVYDGWDTP